MVMVWWPVGRLALWFSNREKGRLELENTMDGCETYVTVWGEEDQQAARE